MKTRKGKKIGKRLSSLRIGDYLRQLSIVILGIIITFAASDFITAYSQSKEIKSALQLLRNELEINQEKLDRISSRIEMEQRISDYILQHRDGLENIPADTLIRYLDLPFQVRSFIYTKDALEMLKASSLFPKIKSRALILQILKTYSDLEIVSLDVKDFYDTKLGYLDQLINQENFNIYDSSKYTSVRKYWKNLLSSPSGWNLCNFTVHNFSSARPFRNAEENLRQTIRMLEKEYRLKTADRRPEPAG